MRNLALLVVLVTLASVASLPAAEAPKGKIIYARITGALSRLHVMDGDGANDLELPGQIANACVSGTWSPDGKRIAYLAGPDLGKPEFSIVICNADGSGNQSVATPGPCNSRPGWSPDGKQFSLLSGGNESPNLYVGNADGNAFNQINPSGVSAEEPFWSVDSSRINYTLVPRDKPKGDLVSAKPNGTDLKTRIAEDSGSKFLLASPGAESPDGKKWLYTELDTSANRMTLRLRTLADGSETYLYDGKFSLGPNRFASIPHAAWSQDGNSFFLSLYTEKETGIFRLNADGSGKTRITPEGVECFGVSLWSGPR